LADPNRTEEAFRVVRAMDGGQGASLMRRFSESPEGPALLRDRPALGEVLIDRRRLEKMPKGSLGRAYLEFCRREGIGPEELLAERAYDDGVDADHRFVYDRMRDSHDLFHVVLGADTDLVGELAVITFTAAQTLSPGVALLCLGGYIKALTVPQLGVSSRGLARQAFYRARVATYLAAAPWEALMPIHLDTVRSRLGVVPIPPYGHVSASAYRVAA